MIQDAFGVPFSVNEATPLEWLAPYGQVEEVWDGLISGNLVFRVMGPYGRLKVKYAGARTVNYGGRPEDAVRRLKAATGVYSIRHRAMPELLACGEVNGGEGFAAVFRWIEGESLHPYPPDDRPWTDLRRQPRAVLLDMLDGVIDLHCALARSGWVQGNFRDSNLIYSRDMGTLAFCSLDGCLRLPAENDIGRPHGSSRFIAPEEYEPHAVIDERTTVYSLGMLIFMMLGNRDTRALKDWTMSPGLYEIARRCVREDPRERWQSLGALQSAWRMQVGFEML